MASKKPAYGWNVSSNEQKNIALPDRFLCRECEKLKSSPQFSNKELNGYRWKKTNRIPVTNITARLRCRNCTGEQTQELQCTGPCTLWKGLDEYSKNQRRRPENAWCLSCTQWKEANEPGVTPVAPPNSALAPDEEKEVAENEASNDPYSRFDIEGDADSDYEENGFIYNSVATMSIADNGVNESTGHHRNASGSYAASSGIPAYLIQPKETSNNSKTKSSTSNPYENRSDYTSEGTVSQAQSKFPENMLPSGFMKGKDKTSDNGTGWSSADIKKPKSGIAYNAWDNAGKAHNQYRAPSQSTGITGSTGMPSHSNSPAPSGVAGGWVKERSTRTTPTQFPRLSRPIKQINYDDDDDSPDEL